MALMADKLEADLHHEVCARDVAVRRGNLQFSRRFVPSHGLALDGPTPLVYQ
jgi:hypothetical protein